MQLNKNNFYYHSNRFSMEDTKLFIILLGFLILYRLSEFNYNNDTLSLNTNDSTLTAEWDPDRQIYTVNLRDETLPKTNLTSGSNSKLNFSDILGRLDRD